MSAAVGLAALGERHHVLDEADGHAEPLEDRPVPLGVALGEIVVHRDEVDARAGERVQEEGERGDERLALTGLHLGDVALVQDDPAHHLDVEHPLLRLAPARLAHGGVGLEEQLVERLAVLEPLAQLGGRLAQLVVRERLEVGLELGDVGGLLGEPLHPAALADAEDLLELAEVGGGHRRRVAARREPSPAASPAANSRPVASVAMRRLFVLALALALVPAAWAATVRTVTAPAPVTALAFDGERIAYATGFSAGDCNRVYVWNLATRGVSKLGRQDELRADEHGQCGRVGRDRRARACSGSTTRAGTCATGRSGRRRRPSPRRGGSRSSRATSTRPPRSSSAKETARSPATSFPTPSSAR